MSPPHSQLAEGYDLQFHTNVTGKSIIPNLLSLFQLHLFSSGHWYLTKLLVPTLLETAKHSPPRSVRVVHVSSHAHYFVSDKGLDFGTFKTGPQRDKMSTAELYMQSKFVCFKITVLERLLTVGSSRETSSSRTNFIEGTLTQVLSQCPSIQVVVLQPISQHDIQNILAGSIDTELYRHTDSNPLMRYGRVGLFCSVTIMPTNLTHCTETRCCQWHCRVSAQSRCCHTALGRNSGRTRKLWRQGELTIDTCHHSNIHLST
jgi:hypothetical protein